MAKLVEILAKELGEWPDRHNTSAISQDSNKSLNRLDRGLLASQADMSVTDQGTWNARTWTMFSDLQVEQIATDHATAIVTREMWRAERDKHSCERVEEVAADILSRTAKDSGYICWMRDRIREIDATIEAMTAERAELVGKLAGEGFALIAVAAESVEPVENMSDWRNWKAGDLVECIHGVGRHHGYYVPGSRYGLNIVDTEEQDSEIQVDVNNDKGFSLWCPPSHFKWVRRSTA